MGEEYSRAVVAAGGAALLMAPYPEVDADAVLARIDGLLLTGGGDVDPGAYGHEQTEECGGVDPTRDAAEIALTRRALAAGLPVLGVCRGLHVLNVALGGTLIQHLPRVTDLPHLVAERRSEAVHEVSVAPGSLLQDIVEDERVAVNSIHHQAVELLAPCLQAVARAPDHIVEAAEIPGRQVLGVQWHPESLPLRGAHLAIFRWLVAAASERSSA